MQKSITTLVAIYWPNEFDINWHEVSMNWNIIKALENDVQGATYTLEEV